MKSVKVFSEKVGKAIDVKVSAKKPNALGWMNSGWSKSGGWFVPASK